MSPLKLYDPAVDAFGKDGYPVAWHDLGDGQGVKHLVRAAAGARCVRCHHPYPAGSGEWSRCDTRCAHAGPVRWRWADGEWSDERQPSQDGLRVIARIRPVEARWRILTVHHLTGVKADLRWWNLAALCQRCHLTIQGRVQMERVYPWPHTEWFKPYAAGWYAWTYLGLELDREQTLARLEELLALEGALA